MAITLVIQPDSTAGVDTMMLTDTPDTNYGTSVNIKSGEETVTVNTIRSLVKFDLSPIPAVATITSCTLALVVNEDRSSNTRVKHVYRQKRAWTELGATWNKYDGTNNWQTAGGFGANDCEQTDIGATSFGSADPIGTIHSFSLTASAIQEMVRGTFTNNGFLLKTDTESDDSYGYNSSDYATAADRPKLTVVYTIPEANSGWWM